MRAARKGAAALRSLVGCSLVAVVLALIGGAGAGALAADMAPVVGDPVLDSIAPWVGGPSVGAAVGYALVKVYGLLHRWTALAETLGNAWVEGDLGFTITHKGRVRTSEDEVHASRNRAEAQKDTP